MKTGHLLLLGLLALTMQKAAGAAETYPKVYDATYETKAGATLMKTRMISNGKGNLRNETEMPGMKSVSIIDMPNHVS